MRAVWLVLLLFVPVLAYAASPVPADLYAEVDHGLRQAAVFADPVGYRGRTLLLGGQVVRTVSEASGVQLEIEAYRLADDDRPETPDPALGLFVASGAGLDGARLQPGRLVTLVGRVTGPSSNTSAAPHLEIRFIHPWLTAEEQAAGRPPVCAPGYFCDPWWHDPWCDSWYWGPYPRWRFDMGYYRHWH
mgnify:CR=1 FL=1